MIFVPAGYQRAEELACSIRELHNAAASEKHQEWSERDKRHRR